MNGQQSSFTHAPLPVLPGAVSAAYEQRAFGVSIVMVGLDKFLIAAAKVVQLIQLLVQKNS